jgi:peptidoglycan/LPS O-acetylase OafA/YrhL
VTRHSGLDVLRVVAILLVMGHHYAPPPGSEKLLKAVATN